MSNFIVGIKLIILFNIGFAVINSIIYYQVGHIAPTIKNLAIYNAALLPLYYLANILITKVMAYGSASYGGDIWKVNLLYWASTLFSGIVFTYIWLGQKPTVNNLFGMALVIIGIIVSNLK